MKFRPIRVQGAHAVAATLTDSWASVPFGPVRGYMLEHGVAHLVAAGRVPRAAELLTTFEWAQARTAELPTATLLALVTDYAGTAARLVGKAQAQVEPWRDFFADNAHLLRRGTGEWPANRILLQRAIEHADDSPVTAVAEAWLATGTCDWLWLRKVTRPARMNASDGSLVLDGHTGPVVGATELPDGRILSWSKDATLRVWDQSNGDCLLRMVGHTGPVTYVGLLPDGLALGYASQSAWNLRPTGNPCLWDLNSGRLVTSVDRALGVDGEDAHYRHVEYVGLGRLMVAKEHPGPWPEEHRNPEHILVIGDDGAIQTLHFTLRPRRVRKALSGLLNARVTDFEDNYRVYHLRWLGGNVALSWHADDTVRAWDLHRATELLVVASGDTDLGRSGLEAADHSFFSLMLDVTANERGTVLRDFSMQLHALGGPVEGVESTDGDQWRVWSKKKSFVWQRVSGVRATNIPVFPTAARWEEGAHSKFTSKSGRIISCMEDGSLRIRDAGGVTDPGPHSTRDIAATAKPAAHSSADLAAEERIFVDGHRLREHAAALRKHDDRRRKDGNCRRDVGKNCLATWTHKEVVLWDLDSGDVQQVIEHGATDASVSPSGQWLVSTHGRICVIDLLDGSEVRSLSSKSQQGHATWCDDERFFCWYDSGVYLHSVRQEEPLSHAAIPSGASPLNRGARDCLALMHNDRGFLAWGGRPHEPVRAFAQSKLADALYGDLSFVATLGAGRVAATRGSGATTLIFDTSYPAQEGTANAAQTAPLLELKGHPTTVRDDVHAEQNSIVDAMMLSTGEWLTWARDSAVRVWDSRTGVGLAVLEGHVGRIGGALEVAPGRVVTWSEKTILLWDVQGARLLESMNGQTGQVLGVRALADGRIFSWSRVSVTLWEPTTGRVIAQWYRRSDVSKGDLATYFMCRRVSDPANVIGRVEARAGHGWIRLVGDDSMPIWQTNGQREVWAILPNGMVATDAGVLELYRGARRVTAAELGRLHDADVTHAGHRRLRRARRAATEAVRRASASALTSSSPTPPADASSIPSADVLSEADGAADNTGTTMREDLSLSRAMDHLRAQAWTEAEPLLHQCLADAMRDYGPAHQRALDARDTLVECLVGQGRREDALKLARESLAIHRGALGQRHDDTIEATAVVIELLMPHNTYVGDLPAARAMLADLRMLAPRHPATRRMTRWLVWMRAAQWLGCLGLLSVVGWGTYKLLHWLFT